jgi:hypothetical protein
MCAARNPNPQLLPLRTGDTGLTYASRLQAEVLRARGMRPAQHFEFEVVENRRVYPRLPLQFPVRMKRVAGETTANTEPLLTENISSTGAFFLAPVRVEPHTPVELEIGLTDRPRGHERVRMHTTAHVVRAVPAEKSGWHWLAVTFDEITFERDDHAGVA